MRSTRSRVRLISIDEDFFLGLLNKNYVYFKFNSFLLNFTVECFCFCKKEPTRNLYNIELFFDKNRVKISFFNT